MDVPSDEEPELEADLEYWQGRRVERAPLEAHEKPVYLGRVHDNNDILKQKKFVLKAWNNLKNNSK